MGEGGPVISVAVTTYQGEKHLPSQLGSIVAQRRLPDEVVVSDDASTDRTWEILTAFAADSPVPVRLLRQATNAGLRRNVERALGACTGTVVVLSDQDDVWDAGKLAAVDAAFADPSVTLWFSDADLVDDDGAPLGATAWEATHFAAEDRARVAAGQGLGRLLHGMTVTGATMAVSADVLAVALPLPDALDGPAHLYLHDGWLAVLAHVMGRTVVDERRLTSYRQHADQLTGMSLAGGATQSPEPAGRGRSARRERLAVDHARAHLVMTRLRDSDAVPGCRPDAAEELRALDEFLGVRMLGPHTRGRRGAVLGQLLRGRYHRYARGLRTTAVDLL